MSQLNCANFTTVGQLIFSIGIEFIEYGSNSILFCGKKNIWLKIGKIQSK